MKLSSNQDRVSFYEDRRRVPMLVAAALVFALGVSVYLFDRPAGYLHVLPAAWGGFALGSPIFGAIGGVLPSFAHAFAFPVLTAMTLADGWARFDRVCIGWALLHGLLELGQSRTASGPIAEFLAPGVDAWPPLGRVSRYFTAGTFDFGDVIAAWLGAFAVAWLARRLVEQPDAVGRTESGRTASDVLSRSSVSTSSFPPRT